MSSPILVAYCPKSADRGPVNFAVAAARFTGAPLAVVAVQPGGSIVDRLSGGEFDEGGDEHAHRPLDGLRDDLDAQGIAADFHVVEHSTPARGITETIEALKPRLVVIGSTHRGRLGRVLPGSTAERIIHGSPAPVAVVPHGHELPAEGVRAIGAAFVPTPEGRAALRTAADLARAAGARVLAITVLSAKHAEEQAPGLMAASTGDQDLSENRYVRHRLVAQDELRAAVAELAEGVETESDVLFQEPVEGLEAASRRVDLLVLGSRAYGPMRAVMLGGVSHRVMREAACPVLVLPRGAESLAEPPAAGTEEHAAQ
jgi:nucleotide-binding universal stress UspA family protein